MRRRLLAGAAAVLLMVGVGVAHAAPVLPEPCRGLTGDDLSVCLWDNPKGSEPTPTPTASPSATPTQTPTANPNTVVTAGVVTASSVEVKWTGIEGATGYKVGRDGRDTSCTAACPWSTTDPAETRSRVFDKLLPDTEYTLTVTPQPDGEAVSIKVTTKVVASPSPSATPTPTPTATQPPVSGSWLSGSAGQSASNGTFGTWRGSPVEIVGTWINDPAIYPFQPGGEHASWTGAVDLGVVPSNWQGWAAESTGANDAFWRATAKKLKEYRGGKGTTYVRPWYEYNGDWMDYSVPNNATDRARFVAAFERVEAIFDAEFPEAKMMLGTAAAGGTASRVTVSEAWPKDVDVLSVDYYNQWRWCNTKACFEDAIENDGGPNSLADLTRLAKAKGVPVMISEWSNAGQVRPASSGGGGEAPVWLAAWYDWLKANAGTGAGQVLGEVTFNIPGYEARFEWYPNTVMPQTAAKYKELWRIN